MLRRDGKQQMEFRQSNVLMPLNHPLSAVEKEQPGKSQFPVQDGRRLRKSALHGIQYLKGQEFQRRTTSIVPTRHHVPPELMQQEGNQTLQAEFWPRYLTSVEWYRNHKTNPKCWAFDATSELRENPAQKER